MQEVAHGSAPLVVLDPMAGSGTVLRQASESGHRALGFDCDPLAVLMSTVWTTPVSDEVIGVVASEVLDRATKRRGRVPLPWVDGDDETLAFVNYWFADPQQRDLRRLAWAIRECESRYSWARRRALNVVRTALSKIVITKDAGASLARDVSHSRPHRVASDSDYDVFDGFRRSLRSLRRLLLAEPPKRGVAVQIGDARRLAVRAESVDLVLTSPPYLNAIDYLRGHRFALVWLGYRLSELRGIRAEAVGTERAEGGDSTEYVSNIVEAMTPPDRLAARQLRMIQRYARDLQLIMLEARRVLRSGGRAVMVVGNSCVRGEFVRNSEGVIMAARQAGLELEDEIERELPEARRYLPLVGTRNPLLGKRMRTESVLAFSRPAA